MPHSTLAPIEAGICYPLPVFEERTGQGKNALAVARKNGLIVRKVGNRKYVFGQDWIDYVAAHGKTDAN